MYQCKLKNKRLGRFGNKANEQSELLSAFMRLGKWSQPYTVYVSLSSSVIIAQQQEEEKT